MRRKTMLKYRQSGPGTGPALLFLLLACSSDALLGPEAPQGIDGLVLLGPQCPVQSEQDPCPDLPYQATINVHDSDGERVTRVVSGKDGRFRVGLKPGRYSLRPVSGNPFPVAGDQGVDVERGVYVQVVVNFDTGIR
jgi:hypothetical protein